VLSFRGRSCRDHAIERAVAAFGNSLATTGSPTPPSSLATTVSPRRTWPLVPPAPTAVVLLGLLIAAVIGVIGVRQLYRQSEASTAARAELLAATLAARMSVLPELARRDVLERASSRGQATVWLIDDRDRVLEEVSGSAVVLDLPNGADLSRGSGELTTTRGTVKFAVGKVEAPAEASGGRRV
jgi:hypothetical protein